MKGKRIEVRRVPCGPLGMVWNERVEDWIHDGMRLVRLAKEYKGHYREKICAKCTPERQVRRKCAALTPGCSVKSCSHMDTACAAKFRYLIRSHDESHPFRQRLRMNAELERRLREDRRGATDHAGKQ